MTGTLRKYSVIYMVHIGNFPSCTFIPKLLRITCRNLDGFLRNNPYYDDIQWIFDGHVKII